MKRIFAPLSCLLLISTQVLASPLPLFSLEIARGSIASNTPKYKDVQPAKSAVMNRLRFQGFWFDECKDYKTVGKQQKYTLGCQPQAGLFGKPNVGVYGFKARVQLFFAQVSDGAISENGQFMAIRNATKLNNGFLREHVRIVEIDKKKEFPLPLIECTTNIMRWSKGLLITASNVDAINPGGTSPKQHAEVCVWNPKGRLLHVVRAYDLGAGKAERPVHRFGFLPKEKRALYVLKAVTGKPGGSCQVIAVDLLNPKRRQMLPFDPAANHTHCSVGPDSIELDLQNFTMEQPSFRYRVHRNKKGPTIWKEVP